MKALSFCRARLSSGAGISVQATWGTAAARTGRVVLVARVVFMLILLSASTVGAFTNDDFANATTLTNVLGGQITVYNTNATVEPGEPLIMGLADGHSIWFRWVAPDNLTIKFSTVQPKFDTLLAVYTGDSVSNLKLIAANDDSDTNTLPASEVIFSAVAGTEYFISIDGKISDGYSDMGATKFKWTVAPPNDDFFAAYSLPGPVGVTNGSNVRASREAAEPVHGGRGSGFSVWYFWDDDMGDGSLELTTAGSGFDTVLAAYTGTTLGTLTLAASNDDYTNQTSRVRFDVSYGKRYYIAVDGAGTTSNQGSIALRWIFRRPAPANDSFANPEVLTQDAGHYAGNSSGSTKEPGEPNHAGDPGGASVWFTWTAPRTAPVTFDTRDSAFDTLLAVYTGTNVSNLLLVAQNDDTPTDLAARVTFNAVAGTTYRIAIDGKDAAQDYFNLDWIYADLATLNNNFANAQIITGLSGSITGNSYYADREPGEPNHAGNVGGHSVWYCWTPRTNATVTFTTEGSNFDTLLAVYTGTDFTNGLTQAVSNDDVDPEFPPTNRTSRVTFNAAAGTNYWIAVDGYAAAPGQGAFGVISLNWPQDVSPPVVTGFTPPSGWVGSQVTINGKALGSATAVRFNGLNANFTVMPGYLLATVPNTASNGTIRVTTPYGTSTSTNSFTVVQIPPPTITSFTPASGSPGTQIIINGSDLKPATTVRFNGADASFIVQQNQLVATVPEAATSGPILVITPFGTNVSVYSFIVLPPPPTINDFTPTSGLPGTQVTISGMVLQSVTTVRFNGTDADFTVQQNQLIATVPDAAISGPILVISPFGTNVSVNTFTVLEPPPPQLRLALIAAGQIQIVWPASAKGFVLQESSDLLVWATAPGSPILTNDQYVQMEVMTGGPRYYRLKK